ncbi:MAG: hypothetical protein OK457_03590 [Thaumarchaeota archaeon]|nr:hypothetical protein [Nitrososphaerota archaeon]
MSTRLDDFEIPSNLVKHAFLVVGSGQESFVIKGEARTETEREYLRGLLRFKPGDMVHLTATMTGTDQQHSGKHKILQLKLNDVPSENRLDFKLNLSFIPSQD